MNLYHAFMSQSFHEQIDPDVGFASLDLPEVPKASSNASSPGMVRPIPVSPNLEPDYETLKSAYTEEDSSYELCSEPDGVVPEPSIVSPNASADASVGTVEDKQFLPFISPPSPSASFSMRQSDPNHALSRATSNTNTDFQNVCTAQAGASTSFPGKQSDPIPSPSKTKSNTDVDMQDVVAAALAAAAIAESAASAARSAASLVQVKITKLNKNRDSPLQRGKIEGSPVTETPTRDGPDTLGVPNSLNSLPDHASIQGSDSLNTMSYDTPNTDAEESDSKEQGPTYQPAHQFQ